MARPEMSELLELPIGERVKLVQELWDGIAVSQDSYPISEAEREELERRLEAYDRDPDAGSSWDEVERRITGR
jgi:putative addiction module component (TIGR02574 family)